MRTELKPGLRATAIAGVLLPAALPAHANWKMYGNLAIGDIAQHKELS